MILERFKHYGLSYIQLLLWLVVVILFILSLFQRLGIASLSAEVEQLQADGQTAQAAMLSDTLLKDPTQLISSMQEAKGWHHTLLTDKAALDDTLLGSAMSGNLYLEYQEVQKIYASLVEHKTQEGNIPLGIDNRGHLTTAFNSIIQGSIGLQDLLACEDAKTVFSEYFKDTKAYQLDAYYISFSPDQRYGIMYVTRTPTQSETHGDWVQVPTAVIVDREQHRIVYHHESYMAEENFSWSADGAYVLTKSANNPGEGASPTDQLKGVIIELATGRVVYEGDDRQDYAIGPGHKAFFSTEWVLSPLTLSSHTVGEDIPMIAIANASTQVTTLLSDDGTVLQEMPFYCRYTLFVPDGRGVIYVTDFTIGLWDCNQQRIRWSIQLSHPTEPRWLDDGKSIGILDGLPKEVNPEGESKYYFIEASTGNFKVEAVPMNAYPIIHEQTGLPNGEIGVLRTDNNKNNGTLTGIDIYTPEGIYVRHLPIDMQKATSNWPVAKQNNLSRGYDMDDYMRNCVIITDQRLIYQVSTGTDYLGNRHVVLVSLDYGTSSLTTMALMQQGLRILYSPQRQEVFARPDSYGNQLLMPWQTFMTWAKGEIF